MLFQRPHSNQNYLKPHEYPTWLIISVLTILIIWGQLMSVLPRALELRRNRNQMKGLVLRADSLYDNQLYKSAILIYKKQYLTDKGVKPIKLSLCYLHLGDYNSRCIGLALLGLSGDFISKSEIDEISNLIPRDFLKYVESSNVRILNKDITYFYFSFEKLKVENPEEYNRIIAASREFSERLKL